MDIEESKERLRTLLIERNDLNHKLPNGKWEDYLFSLISILDSDLSPIKKTVRAQKVMRYIHDNELRESNQAWVDSETAWQKQSFNKEKEIGIYQDFIDDLIIYANPTGGDLAPELMIKIKEMLTRVRELK